MIKAQARLYELSETAQDLADFLERACELLGLSYRQASLQAGLSHGTIWSITTSKVKHGDPDTIASLAVFFQVPEVNLLRLAGYSPKHIVPTHYFEEAEAIYRVLTDEEKERWIEFGHLLLQARAAAFSTSHKE